MRITVLCLGLFLSVSAVGADEPLLPRRAALGFSLDSELQVTGLSPESAAARAGLQEGDVVAAVNARPIPSLHVGRDLLRRLDGGAEVELLLRRGQRRVTVEFVPPAVPFEQFSGMVVEYGVLQTPDGARLRTIVTRPENASKPLPAIFFTQWVSCDSVEIDRPGVWLEVMRAVIESSNMAFIRVERSSGGDSEGPGCHELDYDAEVAHYSYAFDRLVREPLVDTRRVYIWGNSLGSTTAPLVANGKAVAGIIVDGGGALTYFERMLQFDRIGFEGSGMDPGRIDDHMRRHAEFHVEYLLNAGTPEAIVEERPHLKGVWQNIRGAGEGVHYGRPYAWHQQAAKRSFLRAWAQFEGNALVIFHEYDQFENLAGHALIVDTLNKLRPGSATLEILPQTGHDFRRYPSRDHAVQGEGGVPDAQTAVKIILSWLREQSGAGGPPDERPTTRSRAGVPPAHAKVAKFSGQ